MEISRPFNFFILRSPLLSLDVSKQVYQYRSKEETTAMLKQIFSKKALQDAIFLASPYLFSEMKIWLSSTKPNDKLMMTLFKYFIRTTTRSTPFGAFSGISIGAISSDYGTNIVRNDNYKLVLSLNEYSWKKAVDLTLTGSDLLNKLTFILNPTLYIQNKLIKFYTYSKTENLSVLKQVYASAPLLHVMQSASKGKKLIDLHKELVLLGSCKIKAQSFLESLVNSGFLLNPFCSSQVDAHNLDDTIAQLRLLDDRKTDYLDLNTIDQVLNNQEHSLQKRYSSIHDILKEDGSVKSDEKLIYGDLRLETQTNTIGAKQINKFLKQVKELTALTKPIENMSLKQFKQRFFERYEYSLVSLLDVLDADTGIGYGKMNQHYRADDDILKRLGSTPEKNHKNGNIDQFILKKFANALITKSNEIVISERELKELNKKMSNKESETSYIFGTLLTKIDDTNNLYLSLNAASGSSAANLITRFAYLDPKIEAHISDIMHFESDNHKERIVAELLYNPQNSTSSIVKRPIKRDYVIDLNGNYTGSSEVVELKDLFLYINNGKLILWSLSRQKEIIIKLTTAHNYRSSNILYQFLADLQFEHGGTVTSWDWGLLKNSRFLPQVRYKDLILSKATWHLNKLNSVVSESANVQNIIQHVIEEYDLPATVVLVEGDNELVLHLANDVAKQLLYKSLSNTDVTLCEYIYASYDSPVKSILGEMYGNEVIIPIGNTVEKRKVDAPISSNSVQRRFIPGTEWLYLKIYTGVSFSEQLLKHIIPKVIGDLKELKIVDKWFFIRYDNPSHHIRLRIKCIKPSDFSMVLSTLQLTFEPLISSGQIFNIQADTYVRELERYSPELIELCEFIFCQDSEYVISILPFIQTAEDRYHTALDVISRILDKFIDEIPAKIQFCEKVWQNFYHEFGKNKDILKHFNRRNNADNYRLGKANKLIFFNKFQNKQLDNLLASMETLGLKLYSSKINIDQQSIVASIIHMFINRLFLTDQRITEYYLYHAILRHYKMQMSISS